MTDEKKTEEKETKVSSKVKSPAHSASAKPRGAAEAAAAADHAPSKKSSTAASAAVQKSPGTLRIRQVKSGICAPVDQKQTLFGLGLRRIRQEVVRPDTPALRGQIHKVRHLVEIVEGA
jgi:large subunit ribosomal protein L30